MLLIILREKKENIYVQHTNRFVSETETLFCGKVELTYTIPS
jgi:hypothetical protein